MKYQKFLIIVAVMVILIGVTIASAAPPLSGAIFTTTVDGTVINENVRYEAKEDVYLDGGPGPNAPPNAAGLPAGDYYFQVTDPSGKDLLSTDHISCRKVHVNESGVIDMVYAGTNYEWQNGQNASWVAVACQHNQGVDVDYAELGAITVQLFPYDDTPNKGGVYKVWMTPVGDYIGNPGFIPTDKKDAVNGEFYEPGNYHGFIPAASKTDNFKVKQKGPPFIPPEITVKKFHDANLNGLWDLGEEEVTGWQVNLVDPLGVGSLLYTPETVLAAEPGDYLFTESTPAGSIQTVSLLDGVVSSQYPVANPIVIVPVAGTSGETHEVIYGNAGTGDPVACKFYDRNANGIVDEGEPGVAGWRMQLDGTDILGSTVGPVIQETGENGCTTFMNLLPGNYTITELFPENGNWVASGATSAAFSIVSELDGATISGSFYMAGNPVSGVFNFTNYCEGYADFDTKGYWHNKNGLAELTEMDRVYVNGLSPYSSPSSYFDAGDEPFDGFFADGTPVAAAYKDEDGSLIWGEGTWQAEVSHFLTDANAGGDPREQLAQQLLAFIFNVRHRLDDPGAVIVLPDGTSDSAANIIAEAIEAWESEDLAWQNEMQVKLDALNNNDALPYIHYYPCAVIYTPPE